MFMIVKSQQYRVETKLITRYRYIISIRKKLKYIGQLQHMYLIGQNYLTKALQYEYIIACNIYKENKRNG